MKKEMKLPTFGGHLFLFLISWFLLFAGYALFFIFQEQEVDPTLQWQMALGALLNSLFILVGVRGIFWVFQLLGETFTKIGAMVLFGVSVPLLVIDFLIFQQFKFHINSFVLKVMLQPYAFETLGLSWASGVTFLGVLGCGFSISVALWWMTGTCRVGFLRRWLSGRRRQLGLCLLIVVATVVDKTAFAWQLYQGRSEFYLTAQRIPFYIVVQMGKSFKKLDFLPPPPPPPKNSAWKPNLRNSSVIPSILLNFLPLKQPIPTSF